MDIPLDQWSDFNLADGGQPVEIENVKCVRETEKALLCTISGDKHWIPKSQMRAGNTVRRLGDKGTLVITAWLCSQKGFSVDHEDGQFKQTHDPDEFDLQDYPEGDPWGSP